jgi:hypothetical protein
MPKHEAPLVKIGVLGDDDEPLLCSVGPDRVVVSGLQANVPNMGRARVDAGQGVSQPRRQVLVEE